MWTNRLVYVGRSIMRAPIRCPVKTLTAVTVAVWLVALAASGPTHRSAYETDFREPVMGSRRLLPLDELPGLPDGHLIDLAGAELEMRFVAESSKSGTAV